MIEIYRQEEHDKAELKTPKVKIERNRMIFVDENGLTIASAIVFDCINFSINCKRALEHEGYRTDFAEWDEIGGRFMGFLEDVV